MAPNGHAGAADDVCTWPLRDVCPEAEHPLCADTVERLSSGRSIEFVAPLLDPIRSDVEDPTSTYTETTKGLPTGPGLACTKRYKRVCLGHKKCRPEEWRLTVVPQFRLRCSAMVAITKRGSP
jgi:hypothetical protein